jgi:hypothetical protein
MTEVVEAKKWIETYQPVDENGLPVGPLQRFEADTQKELIEKLKAAHMNASVKLYQTRKAAKLGAVLEPDPDEPMQTFEERQLTADERVKVTKMLNDPATATEAYKIMMEAQFGASMDTIRAKFRQLEIDNRVDKIRDAIEQFVKETPEYVESQSNGESIKKYMEKHKLAYTAKNLKIAFEDLKDSGLLTVQAPKVEKTTPAPTVQPVVAAAPAPDGTIPQKVTETPGNSGQQPTADTQVPTEVRPKQSSSGLGRNNSSAVPDVVNVPKTAGITIRDINKMTAKEYQEALKDPEFRKQVDALYAKK